MAVSCLHRVILFMLLCKGTGRKGIGVIILILEEWMRNRDLKELGELSSMIRKSKNSWCPVHVLRLFHCQDNIFRLKIKVHFYLHQQKRCCNCSPKISHLWSFLHQRIYLESGWTFCPSNRMLQFRWEFVLRKPLCHTAQEVQTALNSGLQSLRWGKYRWQ